ncbi:MAG: tetratricopeptide repeat protein [Bacteroidetes bacterium]|jgi:tetratricopeptide (TPR) repeat protein|nr:tetratricopeptide repeat protein [Bacteroidota bacterium]
MAKQTEKEELVRPANPIEKHQKTLSIIGGALVGITLLYVGYTRLYLEPAEEKALGNMFYAESYFGKDSFELALNGNPSFMGFEEVASKYGLTKAGKLAKYYAGICHLKLGAEGDSTKSQEHYEAAADYLSSFGSGSTMLQPMGLGAAGDAYSELGEYEKAAKYYSQAADASDNEFTTPMYLKKAGQVYEHLGKYDQAVAAYTLIKEKYASTSIGSQIDKYISRAQNRK